MQTGPDLAHAECPFHLDCCGELAALRGVLEAAGYTQQALAETAKVKDSGGRLDVPVMLRRTATPSPYHTLVRLFLLAQAVPAEAAAAAVAPLEVEQLVHAGLLQPCAAGVRAEAALIPVEDLLVAHDFASEVTGRPMRPDHVLGVGAASVTLANLTVRRQVEAVLDVGTGSGIQAFLASRHAARVVGTDTNRRALNFAGLSARLNGITNLQLQEGDLYGPVEDARFDLIVANPPFVISPASQYAYRDSALPGDAISEQVIRGAAPRLRDGGFCVVLFNWYHGKNQEWSERPRRWVESSGCDAWILCFDTEDPLSYAANWLRPTEGRDRRRYGELLDEWLRYYEALGIDAVSAGAVILRRRGGRNWIRSDSVPSGQRTGSCGGQIERIFAAQDVLEQVGDDRELLDQCLVLAADHQMEHVLHAENGGWSVTTARLRQSGGFEFTGDVDRLVSAVLAGCDGRHALRELVTDLARGLRLNFEEVAPACLAVVRRLMETGFLGPPDR
jgi:SAM-dependent methyltransferase